MVINFYKCKCYGKTEWTEQDSYDIEGGLASCPICKEFNKPRTSYTINEKENTVKCN